MASIGHLKRLSRIRRRAISAVREAFERGQISARRADTFLYLPPDEQAARLAELLSARDNKARVCLRAASVIEAYLRDSSKRIDLNELGGRIREALSL
jgi:hypothetical protein